MFFPDFKGTGLLFPANTDTFFPFRVFSAACGGRTVPRRLRRRGLISRMLHASQKPDFKNLFFRVA